MSGPDFLDTNVLVYAFDIRDQRKRSLAGGLLRRAVAGEMMASPQVIAEFAATLLRIKPLAATPAEVRRALHGLSPIPLVRPDTAMVRRAVDARERYGINFWDGMIVAAAELGGCTRIWSEDLAAGQEYFGMRVENPFA